MKARLTFLFLLLAAVGFAQQPSLPLDKTTHLITYTGDVPVAGVSQEELLGRAMEWASHAMVAEPEGVRTSLGHPTVVRGPGGLDITYKVDGKNATVPLRYKAKVAFDEGRYVYELTGFVFAYAPGNMPVETLLTGSVSTGNASSAAYLTALRASFDQATASLVTSLRDAMNKSLPKSSITK